MARLLRFAPRYLKDARTIGVRRESPAARALARVFRSLEHAPALPLPGDVYTFVPPEDGTDPSTLVRVLAHVRRVPKHNLWVWYREKNGVVELLALTNVPPG